MTLFALTLSACSLDFSGFPAGQNDFIGPDQGPVSVDGGINSATAEDMPPDNNGDAENNVVPDMGPMDNTDVDMGPAADMGQPDMGPQVVDVGAVCDTDPDCAVGICRLGFCTQACTSDDGCPTGSFCGTPTSESICVPQCAAGTCPMTSACASVSGVDMLNAEGCLPDSDSDGAPDFSDNCPVAGNPDQADGDADGVGDACDGEPVCTDGHVEGVAEIASVTYPASAPSVPPFVGDWFVAAGGDGGLLSARLTVFDRVDGSTIDAALPYGASNFGAAQLGPNEIILTPGDYGDGAQFGRFIHVFRDGATRLGLPFGVTAYDPTISVGADGAIWMHSYSEASGAGYEFHRFDPSTGQVSFRVGGFETMRLDWSVVRDRVGVHYFYSTPFDDAGQGRLTRVTPGGQIEGVSVVYPDAGNGPSAFEPFYLPAPAGQFRVWDRVTGKAYLLDGASFVETPELDVTNDLLDARWAAQRSGLGFVIVGFDPTAQNTLVADSYSLACLGGSATLDSDGDGVIDVLDLCPNDGMFTDQDMDGDGTGDGCDLDSDGDGIPNTDDLLPFDTDNDGSANSVDNDDDADGIPDTSDVSPVDTDNDGLINGVDDDDDGDGFSDATEINAGTDPLDPVHFSGSGTLIWADGGQLYTSALHATAQPTVVQRAGSGAPNSVRFNSDGTYVLLMDGEPGATTSVEFGPVGGPLTGPTDIAKTTYSVDLIAHTGSTLDRIVAAKARDDDPARTELAILDVSLGMFTPLVTVLGDFGTVDVAGSTVWFTGQPTGCSDCSSAYEVPVNGGNPTIVAPEVSNPSSVRYTGGRVILVGNAEDGNGTSAWVGSGSVLREYRPPGATDVSAAVGSSAGDLVLVATDGSGPALWYYSVSTQRWHRLSDLSEATDELDWAR